MKKVDLDNLFTDRLVFLAPHMDDEALACGGLIASLTRKDQIHIIYATDGMKSPSPVLPGRDVISSDLGEIRIKEAIRAMTFLGVPEENLHFLRLPEGQLRKNKSTLTDILLEDIKTIHPKFIFIPFRYDRHTDHLTINHIVSEEIKLGKYPGQIMEYFVYHRWRLLPRKDIRAYIKPECILKVNISDVSHKKRLALEKYVSQTSLYYPWQTRPILTSQLLDEESTNPEFFLYYNIAFSGASVFTHNVLWIKIAHRLEPILKDGKYLVGSYLKRALRNTNHNA